VKLIQLKIINVFFLKNVFFIKKFFLPLYKV
jgi:hypothetical protein